MKHPPLFWFAGVAILFLASVLRFVNLEMSPGWYTDEATHLEIVRHLLNGRIQYFTINQSTLLFSRLPLFELLLATAVSVFGYSMLTLRSLTASLGVLSVGVLIFVVWQMSKDQLLALLCGLLLAIFPQAVLYSRFGFSYNLLVPLLLLAVWGMWLYWDQQSQRGLILATVCLGLGLVSDLLMLAFVPPFLLFMGWVFVHRLKSVGEIGNLLKQVGWVMLVLLLPLGVFTAVSLWLSPPAFWFDLQFVLFRVSPSLDEQLHLLWQNGWHLGRMGWLLLGFVGLLWIRPFALRGLLFGFLLIPLFILGRTASLYSLGFYYMIPFLPFFALGVAGLIRYGGASVMACFHSTMFGNDATRINADWADFIRLFLSVILMSLIVFPIIDSVGQTWQKVIGGWQTEIDAFLLDGEDVQNTAVFLNQLVQDDDLIIASPTVGFLLDGQVADFQMGTAVKGINTPHLPANLPADRYAFNPEFAEAEIVVIDKLWHNWAQIHVPGVVEKMVEFQSKTPIFQAGDIVVYQNKTE